MGARDGGGGLSVWLLWYTGNSKQKTCELKKKKKSRPVSHVPRVFIHHREQSKGAVTRFKLGRCRDRGKRPCDSRQSPVEGPTGKVGERPSLRTPGK